MFFRSQVSGLIPRSRTLLSLKAATILLCGVLVYLPALRGGWLWDDEGEIIGNSDLRSLSGLARMWVRPEALDYQPVRTTVQWIEWHLFGNATPGYHATSLLLHLACAIFLWSVLSRLGVRRAWLGGLLFAIHPLAVESVAWISELKNTLSLALLLLSYRCWLQSLEDVDGAHPEVAREPVRTECGRHLSKHSDFRSQVSAFVFFAASLLSKSSVAMFPFALLLTAWWRRGVVTRRDLRSAAPYFCLSLLVGVVAILFQQARAIGPAGVPIPGAVHSLAESGLVTAFYAGKCLWPAPLIPIYPGWPASSFLRLLVPWLGIALVVRWALRTPHRRSGRAVLFAGGLFVLNLLPVLGVIPFSFRRIAPVADHFAYLSLAVAVGLGVGALGLVSPATRTGRLAFGMAVAGMAVALGLTARSHASVFRDETALWTYTTDRNPDTWLGCNNAGVALRMDGRAAEAVPWLRRALLLRPDYPEGENDLGVALSDLGRTDEAIAHFRRAIALVPAYADAHANLANALAAKRVLSEALREHTTALAIDPRNAGTRSNLGVVLARQHRYSEAADQFRAALAESPEHPEALNGLGNCLFALGQPARALECYRKALAIRPGYTDCRNNLGYVLASLGRVQEALVEFDRVLILRPDDPAALREKETLEERLVVGRARR
jgi:protein O-mannosyl-transferase